MVKAVDIDDNTSSGTLDIVSCAEVLVKSDAEGERGTTDDSAVDTLSLTVSSILNTVALPSSCFMSKSSADRFTTDRVDEGTKRVQNKATRIPLSTIRCLTMKRTTKTKKARPLKMSSRSIQSAFSSAVMSCFEVRVIDERTSCCEEAALRVAVDCSE